MNYPLFVEDRYFFMMHSAKSEKEQLTALTQNLKKIHYLTTTHFDDFQTLIEEYIKVGIELFHMKLGIVSEITGEDYVVCNCISNDPNIVIEKGTKFSLDGTYCREVAKTHEVIGLPHVGTLKEFKNHPVYVQARLEAYISAPIFVNNVLFGTLNFSSPTPREHGFSENERDMISMMANSIGAFLQLQKKEEQLSENNDRLKRLVGFVSHDLRGPLNNIETLASLIESEQHAQEVEMIKSSSKKALEFVHTILETAALGSGKIQIKTKKADLSEMCKERCKYYQLLSADQNFNWQIDIEDKVNAKLDQERIFQVFDNLLSNCCKYTMPGGYIKVSLHRADNMANFSISNTINEAHAKMGFDIKSKVGFGLEIVREILKLHGATLEVTTEGNTYHTSFALGRGV